MGIVRPRKRVQAGDNQLRGVLEETGYETGLVVLVLEVLSSGFSLL